MQRDISQIANESFDLIVVGGGITGAFAAWDAALRGLKVALIERGDWGHATSAASSKVIHGGIRDLDQIMGIENLQTFYRDNDPTPIRDATLIGMNVPCRIGNATCLPGDIVLGTVSGVLFIPPHLAEECVIHSERTRLREIFGLQRLRERTYTSAEMDTQWTSDIEADFAEWRKANTPTQFEHLVWEGDASEQSEHDEPTLL